MSRNRYIPVLSLIGSLLAIRALPALAGSWQLAYEESFVSDPVWTTDNSSNYHWESAEQAFYQRAVDGSDEWAYRALSIPSECSGFRVEFDVNISASTYCGDVRLSLMNDEMSWYGTNISMYFMNVDVGRVPTLVWHANQDPPNTLDYRHYYGRFYTLNQWYHCLLQWDAQSGNLFGRVTDRETGALLGEETVAVAGTFDGIDRVGMTMGGDELGSAVSEGLIDNLRIWYTPAGSSVPGGAIPEPASALALVVGAAALGAKLLRGARALRSPS